MWLMKTKLQWDALSIVYTGYHLVDYMIQPLNNKETNGEKTQTHGYVVTCSLDYCEWQQIFLCVLFTYSRCAPPRNKWTKEYTERNVYLHLARTQTVQICGRNKQSEFAANTARMFCSGSKNKRKKKKANQNKCHALVTSAQALACMKDVTAQWLPHLNYERAEHNNKPRQDHDQDASGHGPRRNSSQGFRIHCFNYILPC